MQIEIYGKNSKSRYSKPIRVYPGYAIVISSFNFACAETDDVGNVVSPADCAVLHKVLIEEPEIPTVDGEECVGCGPCVLEGLEYKIVTSEPIVQCDTLWTHNHQNNVSVLSLPGFYVFEMCNDTMIGNTTILVEEIKVGEGVLIPKELYHGAC